MVKEANKQMKCGCGEEYHVYEHKNGFSIRCENWISHRQNPNGLKR